MTTSKLFLSILFSVIFLFGSAQKTKPTAQITAGPMLGYSEHTECLIWVQTKCAKLVQVQYKIKGAIGNWNSQFISVPNPADCEPYNTKFVITGLQMGTTYEYQILLDGVAQKSNYPLLFKTKVLWEWRSSPPDFTFMLGSCLYINDSAYDRPGKPYGGSYQILNSMTKTPADFMLWLGDNTYLREADYSSKSAIFRRYQHTRALPELQPFLAKMNHYATWDDHDYGDNDANKSYELKQATLGAFTSYWGNKTFGENGEGVFGNFRFSDAEFFLLDDRWFRDESELNEQKIGKTQLGALQLSWLKDKLKHSKASFKFVVVGGQFINENTDKESFNLYQKERQEIIQFIVDQKISGIVFLSGDRHHTELLKNEKTASTLGYPLFDLTCSSITAGPSNILSGSEAQNPQRVPSTLVVENNYCTISITGPKRGERKLNITCYDNKGIVKWGFVITELELKAIGTK
jgi:alkaline phosphatase D